MIGRFFKGIASAWCRVPYKLRLVVVGSLVTALRGRFPDAPLLGELSPEHIVSATGALLAGHVVTDASANWGVVGTATRVEHGDP